MQIMRALERVNRRIEMMRLQGVKALLFSVIILVSATSVQYYFWKFVEPLSFLLFFPSIVIISLYTSRVIAIVSTLLAVLIAQYYFIPPIGSFQAYSANGSVKLVLSWLCLALIAFITLRLKDVLVQIESERARLKEISEALKVSEIQLKAAIEARDIFLSVASHELRTPLTSVQLQLNMANRLLEMKKDGPYSLRNEEQFRKSIHVSLRQTKRIIRLVNDLLNVSLIEAKKLKLELDFFDLAELVQQVVDDFHDELSIVNCNVELHLQKVEGSWDRLRIEQVLVNLISNAIKYAPDSKMVVSVGSIGDTAQVVVQDQGSGIPPEKQQLIFQRFGRSNNTTGISGFGLGLFIVKEIVVAHGGQIQVESEVGVGSKFIVDLPVNKGLTVQ